MNGLDELSQSCAGVCDVVSSCSDQVEAGADAVVLVLVEIELDRVSVVGLDEDEVFVKPHRAGAVGGPAASLRSGVSDVLMATSGPSRVHPRGVSGCGGPGRWRLAQAHNGACLLTGEHLQWKHTLGAWTSSADADTASSDARSLDVEPLRMLLPTSFRIRIVAIGAPNGSRCCRERLRFLLTLLAQRWNNERWTLGARLLVPECTS